MEEKEKEKKTVPATEEVQNHEVPDLSKKEGEEYDETPNVNKTKLTSGAVPPANTGEVVNNGQIVQGQQTIQQAGTPPQVTQVVNNGQNAPQPQGAPQVAPENQGQGMPDVNNGQAPQNTDENTEIVNNGQQNKQDNGQATEGAQAEQNLANGTPTNVQQPSTNSPQPLFKTDPKIGEEFANEIKSWGLNGNVDHLNRPMVSGQDLINAGYTDVDPNSTATVFTISYSLGNEDPKGKYKYGGKSYAHNIVMTPILENGTVFTAEQLDGYLNTLLQTCADLEKDGVYVDPIELDKGASRLIVGYDTPVGIEDKIHQAHQKYYLGGTQQNANVQNGGTPPTNPPVNPPQNQNAETPENQALNGNSDTNSNIQQTNVNENSGEKTVEDWKKNLAEYSPEQLKIIYDNNKDIEGIPANKIKAIEELLSNNDNNGTTDNAGGTPEQPVVTEQGLSEEEKKVKEEAKQSLQLKYSDGSNRNLFEFPVVSEAKMVESGWTGATGKGNQVLHPVMVTLTDGEGNEHQVLMSPIMSNGAVMTQDNFKSYVDNLNEMDDIKAADEGGCGLIIKMDATDDDLKALNELQAEIVKGEAPSIKTIEEEEKANTDEDPVIKSYNEEIKKAQESLQAAEDLLADPSKSAKGWFVEENEKTKKEFDEETEKIKKKNRASKIVANIGDLLQILLNSTGVFLGANSAELSSMSAATNKAEKEQLTLREKRRDELVKNMDNTYTKYMRRLEKDVDHWRDYLGNLVKELNRFKADNAKAFRNAKIKEAQERQKTAEQGQRRVLEGKISQNKENTRHKNRMEEETHKGNIRKEVDASRLAGQKELKKIHSVVEHKGGTSKKGSKGGGNTWSGTTPKKDDKK